MTQVLRSRETANLSAYQRFGSGVEGLLGELSPIRALIALERLIIGRAERREALTSLLGSHRIRLDETDDGIRRLNLWFVRHVGGDASARRLLPVWYSVVNDVALYLGELLIARTGTLRWLFVTESATESGPVLGVTAKGATAYSHPGLIIAFPTGEGTDDYRLHLDTLVADYAHAVLAGHHVDPDYFLNVLLAGVLAV